MFRRSFLAPALIDGFPLQFAGDFHALVFFGSVVVAIERSDGCVRVGRFLKRSGSLAQKFADRLLETHPDVMELRMVKIGASELGNQLSWQVQEPRAQGNTRVADQKLDFRFLNQCAFELFKLVAIEFVLDLERLGLSFL